MIYYEVSDKNGVISFDTLDGAIEYANNNNCVMISEIGGSFDDFEKCWFCGEWFVSTELNAFNECSRCEMAIKQHGG